MKNKKLLMFFLAINSLTTTYAATSTAVQKYDKLYDNMEKNLKTGKKKKKNYQIIEEVLKKRNRELKDLYEQANYIVKPEYLEWQIFFSGQYNHIEGGDNTRENGEYHSDPNHNEMGVLGKSYQAMQVSKEVDLGIRIPIKDVNKEALNLDLTGPEINPPNISVNTPAEPNPLAPAEINIIPFEPTAPTVNIPDLNGAPTFSIVLGSDCNGAMSCSSNTGTFKDGDYIVHYTTTNSASYDTGSEAGIAFKMIQDYTGTKIVSNNNELTSFNTYGNSLRPTTGTPNLNDQIFLVGGSRAYEMDNGSGTLTHSADLSLKGILTLGLVTQERDYTIINSGTITDIDEKNDLYIINNVPNYNEAPLIIKGPYTSGLSNPVEYEVRRTRDGYVGYKVGIANVEEDRADDGKTVNIDNTWDTHLKNTGTIDFRGNNSIGMYTYLPNIQHNLSSDATKNAKFDARDNRFSGTMINETGANIILSGNNSYGIKYVANSGDKNPLISNKGNIILRKNSVGVDKADTSVGMAVMEDPTISTGVFIGNDHVKNNGIIEIRDNVNESIGMYLNIKGGNNLINDTNGKIMLSGTGDNNSGMRVDIGAINPTSDNNPAGTAMVINRGIINVDSVGKFENFAMISNGAGTSAVNEKTITGTNNEKVVGMYSLNGGTVEQISTGSIDFSGYNTTGFAVQSLSTGQNSGQITINGLKASGSIDLSTKALGVYNAGTFTNNGTIIVNGQDSVGVYAKDSLDTKLSSIIEVDGENSVVLFADNTVMDLKNLTITSKGENAYAFYTENNGKFNIENLVTVNVENGYTGLQVLGSGLNNLITTADLTNIFSFSSGSSLVFNVDADSYAAFIQNGKIALSQLSSLSGSSGLSITGAGASKLKIYKGSLVVDQNSNIDTSAVTDVAFRDTLISASSIELAGGSSILGTENGKVDLHRKTIN